MTKDHLFCFSSHPCRSPPGGNPQGGTTKAEQPGQRRLQEGAITGKRAEGERGATSRQPASQPAKERAAMHEDTSSTILNHAISDEDDDDTVRTVLQEVQQYSYNVALVLLVYS